MAKRELFSKYKKTFKTYYPDVRPEGILDHLSGKDFIILDSIYRICFDESLFNEKIKFKTSEVIRSLKDKKIPMSSKYIIKILNSLYKAKLIERDPDYIKNRWIISSDVLDFVENLLISASKVGCSISSLISRYSKKYILIGVPADKFFETKNIFDLKTECYARGLGLKYMELKDKQKQLSFRNTIYFEIYTVLINFKACKKNTIQMRLEVIIKDNQDIAIWRSGLQNTLFEKQNLKTEEFFKEISRHISTNYLLMIKSIIDYTFMASRFKNFKEVKG